MSESDLIPGYLNRSQVPPTSSLPSKIENDLLGQLFFRLYPAAIPDMPAPITIMSLCKFSILILMSYKFKYC